MAKRPVRRAHALLGLVDGCVIFGAFAITFSGFRRFTFSGFRRFDTAGVLLNSLGAAAIGVGAMSIEGLWLERVIAVRWIELAKLTRVAAVLFVGALVLDRVPGSPITLVSALVACTASWVALFLWRSIHRSWLRVKRSRGAHAQRVLVVGSDHRTMDVIRTFEVHPEAGMHVVGIVGAEPAVRSAGHGDLWRGELRDLAGVLATTRVDCAIIGSTNEVGPDILDLLLSAEPDVYSVPVRGGIDARRITTTAFASETLLHVDPSELSMVAWGIKRAFDVFVSVVLVIVLSPVLAIIALAIKTDGGPVLFRQRRVGRDEHEFELLKFRTMVVDAEAKLAALQHVNSRTGPLFKLAVDPRVTRVGRVLRARASTNCRSCSTSCAAT